MCLTVFVASDAELPLIEWSVESRGFNVSRLLPAEESVRRHLKRVHVYALGSHTHCGCGFQRNEDSAPEEVAASLHSLSAYIAAASQHGPVDMYVCWNGEAADEIAAEVALTADALVTDESWIQEGTLSHIRDTAA